MSFWLFMTVVSLLIPVSMVSLGWMLQNKPPKKINSFVGYRTQRSMKNLDTWFFAHEQAGRYWYRTGWVVLVLSLLAMLPVMKKDTETVGAWGAVVCLIQCVPLTWVLFVVERALKRTFDENGTRIKP